MKIITMGCLKPERKIKDNYLVYGVGGICPTIRARDYKDPKKVVVNDNGDIPRQLLRNTL